MSFQPWSLCIKKSKTGFTLTSKTLHKTGGLGCAEMRLAVPSLLFLISRCTTQSHAAILASSFFFVFAPELSMLCVLSAKRLRSLIKPARTEHDTHFGGFVSAWISCVVKSLESLREMFPNIVWSMWRFLSFFPPSFFKSTMEVMVICRPGRITVFVAAVADHEFSDVGILSV